MFRLIWAIIFIVVKYKLISCTTIKHKPECGYKQCPQTRDGALNVHLIPHSHMDAGWVKTFDEYYHGTRTSISTANVQLIFHSVLSELLHDKRRKFVLSETAYFWRWWKEQRPVTRSTFRTLIQEGRIEFAGGGWVQNDEATVDYLQIIDQYTWGLRKINDTLGPCGKPKAGWQIDTYGHSREQASLLAQMGYDGLFIGRVDYKERESMIEEDRMEYMWRGSDVLGKMSDIMTHTLFNLYNAPDGFCFDFLCNDEPIVEDPDSKVFNADKRVNDFIAQIERQAKYYEHDNILVTMGGDFTFQSAASWYMNMDKLINHVNTHTANLSDINIFYSTPSCYLKSVYLYGRRDKAIYTERGDHFPYGSDTTTYWTGFFSSRPTVKYFAKRGHLFLQVVKQLTVISRTGDSYELHLLRHAVSLILHHDAITGTSQQHVTDDFVKTLHDAIDTCTKKISNLLSYLTPTWGGSRRSKNNQQFVVCHQLNMSQCEFTETHEAMLLLIYNPSSVKTYYTVRLPAIAMQYSIRDANDDELEYQLLPLPAAIINLPGRTSPAIQELVFEAENIPPIGFSAFYLTPVRDQLEESQFARKAQQSNTAGEQELLSFISNEYLKVSLDKNTGLLDSIQHVDGARIIVSQNYYVYSQGQPSLQSGSYSFRPAKDRPMPVTNHVTYHAVRGNLVKEIRQRFTDWITQIIRLYRGEEFVEIEWIIGPVPIDDMGKEVVSIFATNISNGGDFFTDSNGRQMVKRSCLNLTNSQRPLKPVPACYFPVTSRICIHSSNSSIEMCVLTDRAQGGTSYNNGEIELMVHRRLLTDDGFGLEEPLNEESHGVGLVVRGKHRIIFGNYKSDVDELTFSERTAQAARRWDLEPWTFMTPGEKVNRRKWQNVRNKRFTALRPHGLPRHIHILTLEPWKAGSVLLRLENTLQNGRLRHDKSDNAIDYHTKSSHITVELSKLFAQLQIKTVRETTLAANQWLEDARQMDWSTRYVYSGADDGLLPEDAELTEDNKLKQKDKDTGSEPSDEDRDFMHKSHHSRPKIPRKSRAKIKSTTFLRKRRSLNVTDSIFENLTNDTYDRNKDEYTFMNKFFDGVANATVKAKTDNTTAVYTNNTKDGTIDSNSLDKIGIITSTAKTKLNYKGLAKNTKLLSEFQKESDELSEEDALSKLRKRSARRRFAMPAKKNMDLDQFDESDDEITKSIYEMYYKSKPRLTKTWSKHDDETDVQPKRKSKAKRFKNDYEDEDDRVTRKYRISNKRRRGRIATSTAKPERRFRSSRKGIREGGNSRERDRHEDFGRDFDLAFGRNEKPKPSRHKPEPKPKAEDEDDIPMDFEEDMDDERMEAEFEEGRYKRKKRQSSKDERDDTTTERDRERDRSDSENEYLITLRPSQIRTFVIWFENTRKTYTM